METAAGKNTCGRRDGKAMPRLDQMMRTCVPIGVSAKSSSIFSL